MAWCGRGGLTIPRKRMTASALPPVGDLDDHRHRIVLLTASIRSMLVPAASSARLAAEPALPACGRARHARCRSREPHPDLAVAAQVAGTFRRGDDDRRIAVRGVSLASKGDGAAGLDRLEAGEAVGRGEADAFVALERRGRFSERWVRNLERQATAGGLGRGRSASRKISAARRPASTQRYRQGDRRADDRSRGEVRTCPDCYRPDVTLATAFPKRRMLPSVSVPLATCSIFSRPSSPPGWGFYLLPLDISPELARHGALTPWTDEVPTSGRMQRRPGLFICGAVQVEV